jgi:Plasmid pRiA4b ORF-3-like protein
MPDFLPAIIYQLKVALRGISPLIWRRLLVRADTSLADLHHIFQHAMGFVESTVNQVVSKRFVKKQQMRWSPRGAHLVLQMRTRVLNDELQQTFQRWYPGMQNAEVELKEAA